MDDVFLEGVSSSGILDSILDWTLSPGLIGFRAELEFRNQPKSQVVKSDVDSIDTRFQSCLLYQRLLSCVNDPDAESARVIDRMQGLVRHSTSAYLPERSSNLELLLSGM